MGVGGGGLGGGEVGWGGGDGLLSLKRRCPRQKGTHKISVDVVFVSDETSNNSLQVYMLKTGVPLCTSRRAGGSAKEGLSSSKTWQTTAQISPCLMCSFVEK